MRIGIDVSQMAHKGTGVASYTKNLVEQFLKIDEENEYVFFFSSLRKNPPKLSHLKAFKIPPIVLEFLWNRLHLCPIEWFIGKVDVFLSSDWLQPPTGAKKVTTIHDLIVYKYPESFQQRGGHNIVTNQKKRLKWIKKECDVIICDSEATKKDVREILGIPEAKLKVVYPGGKC
jgi:glycosyltransferase involved in cell wall biosynthesis